jgi:hypothetical protein
MKTVLVDSYGVKELEESLKLYYRPLIYKKENDELDVVDVAFEVEEAEFKNKEMLDDMLDMLRAKDKIIWWQDKEGNVKLIHPTP